MKLLVINDVAGRLDQLQGVLQVTGRQAIDAILVLGNLVATTSRRDASALEAAVGDLPASLGNSLEDEIGVEPSTYADALALLGSYSLPVYLIPGAEDDLAALDDAHARYTGPAPLISVHGTAAGLGTGTVIAGLGGAIAPSAASWNVLEYRNEEIGRSFEHTTRVQGKLWQRPQRILLFATSFAPGLTGAGTVSPAAVAAINDVIGRYTPQWVFCGGRNSKPASRRIGRTIVVQPGEVTQGQFALVDIDHEDIQLRSLVVPLPLAPVNVSVFAAIPVTC